MNMQIQEQQVQRRPNPRRRKRSKLTIFKEVYLPALIFALATLFILISIIGGAIRRNTALDNTDSTSSTVSTPATQDPNQAALLAKEAQELLKAAATAADNYDYAGAMALLDSFSGEILNFPELVSAYNQYKTAADDLVSWSPSEVPNLSFHVLIADPDRAFPDKALGSSYKRNFITTTEFSGILQELYNNGYILVDLEDLYTSQFSVNLGRDVYQEKELLLPAGKKPVMITEVNASYYTYMVDGDSDGKPDAKGDGFAYRLCHGENGFYNEIVLADGSTATGAYDMVPILEDFIAQHPDFSYRGARATVAFTGSDGILGYRTNSKKLDAEALQQEKQQAANVAQALRNAGYSLASYTFDNIDYGTKTATQIQSDLQKWQEQVTSIIGQVDILAFARNSDIGGTEPYDGTMSKFNLLHNAGFRYFMGVSEEPWNQVGDLYVRHNRLMLSGENLTEHPELFFGLFNVQKILDPARS